MPKEHKKKDKKHHIDRQDEWSQDDQQIEETNTSTVRVSPTEGVRKKKRVKVVHPDQETPQ